MAVRLGGGQDAAVLDRLATAYARAGRREAALETGARALARARATGPAELAASVEAHLRRYQEAAAPAGSTVSGR